MSRISDPRKLDPVKINSCEKKIHENLITTLDDISCRRTNSGWLRYMGTVQFIKLDRPKGHHSQGHFWYRHTVAIQSPYSRHTVAIQSPYPLLISYPDHPMSYRVGSGYEINTGQELARDPRKFVVWYPNSRKFVPAKSKKLRRQSVKLYSRLGWNIWKIAARKLECRISPQIN